MIRIKLTNCWSRPSLKCNWLMLLAFYVLFLLFFPFNTLIQIFEATLWQRLWITTTSIFRFKKKKFNNITLFIMIPIACAMIQVQYVYYTLFCVGGRLWVSLINRFKQCFSYVLILKSIFGFFWLWISVRLLFVQLILAMKCGKVFFLRN